MFRMLSKNEENTSWPPMTIRIRATIAGRTSKRCLKPCLIQVTRMYTSKPSPIGKYRDPHENPFLQREVAVEQLDHAVLGREPVGIGVGLGIEARQSTWKPSMTRRAATNMKWKLIRCPPMVSRSRQQRQQTDQPDHEQDAARNQEQMIGAVHQHEPQMPPAVTE